MRIISIDPGYDRVGIAVLEKEKGEILELQPLFQALIDELLKPVTDTV